MLTQNYGNRERIYGQTTLSSAKVKKSVIILAEVPGQEDVKYIHGNLGKALYLLWRARS